MPVKPEGNKSLSSSRALCVVTRSSKCTTPRLSFESDLSDGSRLRFNLPLMPLYPIVFIEICFTIKITVEIFVPTPLVGGGGEELYTQMGFFFLTILADRYIHRREM